MNKVDEIIADFEVGRQKVAFWIFIVISTAAFIVASWVTLASR